MPDRTVTYNFRGNFSNLSAGLTAQGRAVQDLGTKMTALDRNGAKMRAGLTQIGDTAGRVGLLFAAGVGVAVGVAANFDKAMSSVQAATHETAENMDELREAAIQAGADTAYSASEAAGAIEELAKAGISTSDILGGGLAGSLDLAAAGAIEVADAAEIAATAMTQFSLSGDQVNHVADLLAAGAGKAQGSVDDLGMALKQSGLVASQTGLSIEETTGTLAAFASAGLIGSDAGTSFKTMLQSLTPSSKEAKDLMNELGISAYDAQGNFIGMAEFAGVLQTALGDLSVEQQNAALKTIFGADAVRAASVIFEQGASGVQSWIDKTNDSGYAAETAATRLDNLSGDLEQFKGSLETALIGTGEGAQGPLRELTQGATAATNAFNDMPGPAKNAALALAGITAVTGGSLWFGAKVINGVAETRQALADLGVAGTRTGRALAFVGKGAGVAAAALGGLLIIDQIQSGAKEAAPGIEEMTKSLLGLASASDLPENLDGIADSIDRLANPNAAQALQDNIAGVIGFGGGSELANAQGQIEALDQALAGLVATAGEGAATAAFDRLAASAELSKSEISDLESLLPNYSEALLGAENAATLAADAESDLADETSKASVEATRAADRQVKLAEAMAEQKKAAEDSARGWISLGDSLGNAKKSLGEWLREMEKQAEALRNFTQNAQTAAKKGLDEGLIRSLNEAGPVGALRMKQLANATDSEIGRANRAWRDGQKAIRDYVNMQVPPKTIRVDTSQAKMAVADIQARINSLRSKTIAIDIATGQRRAGGGPIEGPGTKTSDSVPVWASRGEFMMSAAAVDHYGLDTMFKMNARRLASGGSVDGKSSRGAGSSLPSLEYLLGGIAELNKRELEVRQRQLEKYEQISERQLDAAKDRLDEERAALKDLRDARRQFMQEVAGNFRTDVFGGGIDLAQAFQQGSLGPEFGNQMFAFWQQQQAEAMANGADFEWGAYNWEDVIQDFLASLSQEQLATYQAQATVGQLNVDASAASSFEQVLEQLREMGLTGGAYNELALSGNLAQAQAYLSMGPEFIQTLMQSFRSRNEELRELGAAVGNVRFGADIHEQLQETRKAVRIAERQEAELREIKQANREMARRLERIENQGPKKMGDATAAAMNNTVGGRR